MNKTAAVMTSNVATMIGVYAEWDGSVVLAEALTQTERDQATDAAVAAGWLEYDATYTDEVYPTDEGVRAVFQAMESGIISR